ncbi:hypothetical protein [Candidatus Kuenenia stuttgartiensis]|uniref:Uncharacterized protein n=1 Tax=Kuenenia stuttgartiensis TaxID=174633 RepID=Q1Q5C6_KUEST|nr:hypothetical protein [Candidatus Kuenenia stuttgartiensis]CAJ75219.1 unknown protein [Candidatus Kuenenia stuttgartiensis]
MRVFTLFIKYQSGAHYCGVYPTLEYLYDVLGEMADDGTLDTTEIPELSSIRNGINDEIDDFYHEFSNGAWIHVQETSKHLVGVMIAKYESQRGDYILDDEYTRQAHKDAQIRRETKGYY